VIALIDYGAGNLTSVRKALSAVGAAFYTPATPADLDSASHIIVPGVGHFAAAAVLQNGWREAIARHVSRGGPLLGVCLGMQWLFDGSDEEAAVPGLGAIGGRITRIEGGQHKVPHVGWNTVEIGCDARILDGVASGSYVYFTHSYAAPLTAETVATTTHGSRFASVVERRNIFGVQFHPEKSADSGLRILRNFVDVPSAAARAR
jgi:glutamine amidotransferase